MSEPRSAADRRPNDEPYFISKACEDCGEKLVYLYILEGKSERDAWFDEFACPKCRNGMYLDVPEGYIGKGDGDE